MTRRRLLDDTFKKSVVGNPAIATDSLARMYPGIVMNGWTTQDGTPTPETPVPIVSAGTQSQETGKWDYEITIANAQTDPDKNQTVTLTADRPLTKWDKLEKRGGQWGWVYKSSEVIIDGSEGEDWGLYSNEAEGTSFYVLLPGSAYGYHTSFCNKYKNVTGAWNSANKNQYCIYSDHLSNSVKYFRPPSEGIEDVDGWITWIRSNPLTLSYETSTETFVPLSSSEQDALNALHTYRPTTVLSNQQDCEMALTYKTRKSMEVTA